MGTVVYLVGPKAVGKSWVGSLLEDTLDVFHVDADPLILDLIAQGISPHSVDGWRPWVEPAVIQALESHGAVSVEATGAFEQDYDLAENLERLGHHVLRIWLTATEEETLSRLESRTAVRVPASQEQALAVYQEAHIIAADKRWDLIIDTSGPPQPEWIVALFREFL